MPDQLVVGVEQTTIKVQAPTVERVAIVDEPSTDFIVVREAPRDVVVLEPVVEPVKIYEGIRGPEGPQGPVGPQGPQGEAAAVVFTADCPASMTPGDGVIVSAARNGANLVVDFFDPYEPDPYLFRPAVGVCLAKLTSTTCTVIFQGLISGVYSGLTPGRRYLLGADARPTLTRPPFVGGVAWAMPIGMATSTDELFVRPTEPNLDRG